MTSLFRVFRSNPSRNRHSTASTYTHSSTKTDVDHTTYPPATVGKRGHSLFVSRASWTPGMTTSLDYQGEGNTSNFTNTTSSSISAAPLTMSAKNDVEIFSNGNQAAADAKRFRNITPKIQALKAMFEFRSVSSESDKENSYHEGQDLTPATASSATDTTPLFSSQSQRQLLKRSQSSRNPRYDGDENFNNKVITVSPAQTRVSADDTCDNDDINELNVPMVIRHHNAKLRSMPSIVDMAKIKWSKDKKRSIKDSFEMALVCDQKIENVWSEKSNQLVEWVDAGWSRGEMPKMIQVVQDRLKGPSINGLLTPEEDLKECTSIDSCHPHLTPYFAKVLRNVRLSPSRLEAATLLSAARDQAQTSRPLATIRFTSTYDASLDHEAALYLIHHPCRVPLVFRIEAAHLLLESSWDPITKYTPQIKCDEMDMWIIDPALIPKLEVLLMAWKWCHQLETTALMVRLIHRTHQLWNDTVGDLALLPTLDYAPPHGGYAAKDWSRCR